MYATMRNKRHKRVVPAGEGRQDERITLYVSKRDKAEIERASQYDDLGMSGWVAKEAVKLARAVLTEKRSPGFEYLWKAPNNNKSGSR